MEDNSTSSQKMALQAMNPTHLQEVAEIDARCHKQSRSKSEFRKAVRDEKRFCWVVVQGDEVVGYMVAMISMGEMLVDRIGYRAEGAPQVIRSLMSWVYYVSQEKRVEQVVVSVYENQLALRSSLNAMGFYAYKPAYSMGEGDRKQLLTKQMRESTWLEGTHYPDGDKVVDEILNGSSRVLILA